MRTTRSDHEHTDLTDTCDAFARWRAKRPKGARIPPELWQAAVASAALHGVSRTAIALNLDYYTLKRRLEDEGPAKAERPTVDAPQQFVELPLSALEPPPPTTTATTTCAIEIERADDTATKLRIEFGAIPVQDLPALVTSLSTVNR